MLNVSQFIADHITGRQESMFAADIEANRDKLRAEIERKSVLVIGGLRTWITSPTLIMREGLIVTPPIMIRPFLQASAAIVRVLKIRVAHIHLSIRTSFISVFSVSFYLLLN